MITLMTIGYITCVMIAFKVIKIKVTPISVAISVLIGFFMLGGILIAWKMAAPMTGQMTVYRKVIPILPNEGSKEFITKVFVKMEQRVKKGTPLFETDTRPNQYTVDQFTAQVAVLEQNILVAQAAVDVAAAQVEKAQADSAVDKADLDTAVKSNELLPGSVAKLKVVVAQESYQASVAAISKAIALQHAAEFALTTAKNLLNSEQSQLNLAKLNLSQNTIVAPADGYIANWQAIVGTMSTTMLLSAQGSFIDTGSTSVVAVFPQNLLKNVEPGDVVEIAFKGKAGIMATGKVDAILEYTGEGQLITKPVLPIAADLGAKGFLVVTISLDDEKLAAELPLGAAGTVAIYTNALKPFHIITKITVRIKMWTYYLPF